MKRINRYLSQLPSEAVYHFMESPVGALLIFASDKGLHHILWAHESGSDECKIFLVNHQQDPHHPLILKTKRQLLEYFEGDRQHFDIPLCVNGTPFQLEAWAVLSTIPYGQTLSYSEQAMRLGDKNKSRAVGMANGLNPISIIVPCHRVIGRDGSLTGFGGGIENKARLLALEKKFY